MEYSLLRFFHVLGAVLIGSGLIGVWMADLRSRQLHELKPFSEAVRAPRLFGGCSRRGVRSAGCNLVDM